MIYRRLLSIVAVVGVTASPLQAYFFFSDTGPWPGVTSSARAIRWEREALPLRFRILDTGNLPQYGDLSREKWREIVRAGIGAWDAVETADINIVLEDLQIASIRSDSFDGINTIGFEVGEDLGYPASAAWTWRDGRMRGCDIHLDPTIFDNWPRDDPAVKEWAAYFLEELVTHEMGHCLGLSHVPANPVWLGQSANSPNWPPGFLPETLAGLSSDPQMSIAASHGVPRLMPDDRIGVSLIYPAPGFIEERGSIGGRVAFPDGRPAAFVYVQAVDYASGTAVFGQGAFADERGQFRVEGLPDGPVHLWVRPTRIFSEHPAFQDAGTANILDEHRWFSVRAGVVTIVPEITVMSGRRPP